MRHMSERQVIARGTPGPHTAYADSIRVRYLHGHIWRVSGCKLLPTWASSGVGGSGWTNCYTFHIWTAGGGCVRALIRQPRVGCSEPTSQWLVCFIFLRSLRTILDLARVLKKGYLPSQRSPKEECYSRIRRALMLSDPLRPSDFHAAPTPSSMAHQSES